jgi:hypothetical protein
MAKTKNVVKESSTITIDGATGEVQQISTTQQFASETEPAFVKLYLKDIIRLKELPPSTSSVLHAILNYMNYNNEIILIGYNKKTICANLNIPMNTLNKAIDNLFKANILIRVAPSCYVVDPELFGKGSWKDIKNIRLSIEYTEDAKGRSVKQLKSNIAEQQEKAKQLTLFNNADTTTFVEVDPKAIQQNNNFDAE